MDKLVTEYIWLLRQPEASIKFSHQSRYFFNSKHQSNSRAGLEINQCEQVLARNFSQADSPATFPPPQPHAPPPEINPFRKLQGTPHQEPTHGREYKGSRAANKCSDQDHSNLRVLYPRTMQVGIFNHL